jgi:hypothetical protein
MSDRNRLPPSADTTEARADARLSAVFRAAGFPPTPAGVEAAVRARLGARRQTIRLRRTVAAAAAAVLVAAVGLLAWTMMKGDRAAPSTDGGGQVAEKPAGNGNGGGVDRPAEPGEAVAILRSRVLHDAPSTDMTILRRTRDAEFAVLNGLLDEWSKEN